MKTRPSLRILVWILPLVALVSLAFGDETADLRGQMQGTWTATSVTGGPHDGTKLDVTMTVEKDKATLIDKSFGRGEHPKTEVATMTLDASQTPAHIDLKVVPDKIEDETGPVVGLVKVVGDEMTMVFRKKGDRPTTFDGGEGITVLVFKRIGPATMPSATQP